MEKYNFLLEFDNSQYSNRLYKELSKIWYFYNNLSNKLNVVLNQNIKQIIENNKKGFFKSFLRFGTEFDYYVSFESNFWFRLLLRKYRKEFISVLQMDDEFKNKQTLKDFLWCCDYEDQAQNSGAEYFSVYPNFKPFYIKCCKEAWMLTKKDFVLCIKDICKKYPTLKEGILNVTKSVNNILNHE